MKKLLICLTLSFVFMFVCFTSASAVISVAGDISVDGTATGEKNVNMNILVSGNSKITTGNEFYVILHTPNHILNNSVTVNMNAGWTIDGQASKTFDLTTAKYATIKYTGTAEITSTVTYAVATYTKDDAYAEGCGFSINTTGICYKYNNTTFTNRKGEYVTEENYYKDCYTCLKPGDTVPASEGAPTITVDGYYDKNGQPTDEPTYRAQCDDKLYCQKSGNDYYGIEGTVVTEAVYYSSCFSCLKPGEKNSIGIEVTKYHGKDGRETTEAKYTEECEEKKICKIDGDDYYDFNGNKVTEKAYYTSCFSCLKPGEKNKVGETVDAYYGVDGRKLTGDDAEATYKAECDSNTPTKCYIDKDGKYYDKDGKEVDEDTYKKECGCRVDNGKYYNDKNVEITKEEYINQCEKPAPTGSFIPYVAIIGGAMLVGTSFIVVKKRNKFKRI